MATAAEPSSSPSPHLCREGRAASPWSQVVRREPEAAALPAAELPSELSDGIHAPSAADTAGKRPEGADALIPPPDGVDGSSAAWGKKAAWIKPSNGLVEASPVMGAASWPALSEAARAAPRSSTADAGKGVSDGSASSPTAPTNMISSPSRQLGKNAILSSSGNLGSPTRQKFLKRVDISNPGNATTNSSSGALANGDPVLALSLPASAELCDGSGDNPVVSQMEARDVNNRSSGNWDHGSLGMEQHRNYGSNRRGSNGGGGVSPYHNNFGNRRGGYEWNNRSVSGGRDLQMQQHQPRAMARPFLRPLPPGSAPFMTSPPVRPFTSPISYYDIPSPVFYVPQHPSPEPHGGMPFVGVGPPAMFYAPPDDSQLRMTLAKQIEYYFSSENLCKDIYLRQNMDKEGWVSIALIAGFNRIRNLTNNIHYISDTVRTSSVVEVQGDKIRRRNDWMNWPPLTSPQITPLSSIGPSPGYETVAAQMRKVNLEEPSTARNGMMGTSSTEAILHRSVPELNGQPVVIGAFEGKGSEQSSSLSGSGYTPWGRNLGRSDTF